jgi:trk system potassium uptake protein TrkH
MREGIDRLLSRLLFGAAVLAAASLVAQYGFFLTERQAGFVVVLDLCVITFFVLQNFARLGLTRERLAYLEARRLDFALIALLVVQLVSIRLLARSEALSEVLARLNIVSITKAYIVAAQIYMGAVLVTKTIEANRFFAKVKLSPPQVILASFALVIATGTLLLMMPRARATGISMPLIDALFTSTSATCVTGLVVVDTGTYFSRLGQCILLALIQVGGLGIMSLFAFSAVAMGRGIGMREGVLMRNILDSDFFGEVGRLVRNIVLVTVGCEVVGAVILSSLWAERFGSPLRAVFYGVFHSVSAFCNAGFTLFSNNLESFRGNAGILVTVAVLIMVGGLGFMVISNLLSHFMGRVRRAAVPPRLTLHTKIVLVMTACLVVGGAILFQVLEGGRLMEAYTGKERWLSSFFMAVTARTAGFNCVPTAGLAIPGALILMTLMFIGASPGGTGGGVKTSTLAVLLATVRALLRSRPNVEIFKRTLPQDVINRAICVFLLSLALVFLSSLAISVIQPERLVELAFEATSAFGTVGLSMGLTMHLTTGSKIAIMLTMFLGRIGPLTLALAVGQRVIEAKYSYPAERAMIG